MLNKTKMSKSQLIIPVLLAIFSFKCKPPDTPHQAVDVYTSGFPPMKMLEPSSLTQFVPVLEARTEKGKNIIYTVSLALAWDELINKIGKPSNLQSNELELMEQSVSYKGALDTDEYVRDIKVEKQEISIYAGFGGSLTFHDPLDSILYGAKFNGEYVRAFGVSGFSLKAVGHQIGVLYYKSDDEFIISIQPEQQAHEIILAKGFSQGTQLSTMLTNIYAAIDAGWKSDKAPSSAWKYMLNDDDEVTIPVVSFNLGNDFDGIEESRFTVGHVPHRIKKAYQRTALVLNEYGAKIEGEAKIVDVAAAIIDMPEKPPVKHLVFDKPFVVILKKDNVRNPYFMMKVENTELMVETTASPDSADK